MFRWYAQAQVCYAHLFDVPSDIDLMKEGFLFTGSCWFTRGWTLQEILAPSKVVFFAEPWHAIGTRDELCSIISRRTGIHENFLRGDMKLCSASLAERMSWASKRRTTRTEDMAYCLLGIFGVNMPLI